MALFYHVPKSGTAIIRRGFGGTQVAISSGIFVFPGLHQIEVISLGTTPIKVTFNDEEGLLTKDDQRIPLNVTIYVAVSPTYEDITRIVFGRGVDFVNSSERLSEYFIPKVREGMAQVFRQYDHAYLADPDNIPSLKDDLLMAMGIEFEVMRLKDVAFNYEQPAS